MSYFKKVKVGDEVFGLVYGKGIVKSVWEDSHYTFEVEYDINCSVVPYTPEGFPGWNTGKLDFQTVFYASEIDLMDYDFSPSDEILSAKKIIKLRDKKKLEIKCPSGLWQPMDKCPNDIANEYLENGLLYLFRKAKNLS
jgi:hypothetical protein